MAESNALPLRKKNLSLRSLGMFLLVGGFATGLQYLCMAVLIYLAGFATVLASGIGFGISAIANYFLNARLTFRSARTHRETAPRFIATALAGLAVNSAVIAILLYYGMHAAPAQLVATACVLFWNYMVNAIWTFKHPTT